MYRAMRNLYYYVKPVFPHLINEETMKDVVNKEAILSWI